MQTAWNMPPSIRLRLLQIHPISNYLHTEIKVLACDPFGGHTKLYPNYSSDPWPCGSTARRCPAVCSLISSPKHPNFLVGSSETFLIFLQQECNFNQLITIKKLSR